MPETTATRARPWARRSSGPGLRYELLNCTHHLRTLAPRHPGWASAAREEFRRLKTMSSKNKKKMFLLLPLNLRGWVLCFFSKGCFRLEDRETACRRRGPWPRSPWLVAVERRTRAAGERETASGGNGDEHEGDAFARRLLDAAGRLRRDHPGLPEAPAGEGIGFKTSFGASGDQSRAVEAGLEADVVTFSHRARHDAARRGRPGRADDWTARPAKGLVTNSVVSFVVRKGNPKNIRTWDDLLKPGVEVLTPEPVHARARRSGTCSPPTARLGRRQEQEAGLEYVREADQRPRPVQDKSGREALQNFISGTVTCCSSYEYEATTARRRARKVDYVVPDDTIKIDIDIARTKAAPTAAQEVARLRAVQARAGEVRRVGLPARSTSRCSTANKGRFREPGGPVHDRGPRRLVEGQRRAVRIEEGAIAKIKRRRGSRPTRAPSPLRARRAPGRARPGALPLGISRSGSASSSCCRWRPSSSGPQGRFRDVLDRDVAAARRSTR